MNNRERSAMVWLANGGRRSPGLALKFNSTVAEADELMKSIAKKGWADGSSTGWYITKLGETKVSRMRRKPRP